MKHDPVNGYTNGDTWITAALIANQTDLLQACAPATTGEELRDLLRPILMTSPTRRDVITGYRADVSRAEFEEEVNWTEVLGSVQELL